MKPVTLEEAAAELPTLIARMEPGEEVLITRDAQPVARLIAEAVFSPTPRRPGSAIGRLTIVGDDESHLNDFRDYTG